MKQAVIYQIKCIINDKVYIGSSIDLKNRWKCHRHHLRAGTHHSITLQLAWKTYGESKFIISTLESCSVQEQYAREKHWIDKMQAASIEHGFNICPNPKTREGLPHTAETKAKISLSNKGKKKTAEHIRRIVEKNRGRVVSDETRQKLSEAAKGRKWTDEQRASVRGMRVGWHHSETTRQAIREKAIGRSPSESTRKKLSDAGKGRKWTENQRRLMAELKRQPPTDEQRIAISRARGGAPFIVKSADGDEYVFQTLQEVRVIGLDPSNVHKCLIGNAKTTKGYTCTYKENP